LGRDKWFVASNTVLEGWLHIEMNQQKGYEGRRAKAVMKRLGWGNELINNKELGKPMRGFIREITGGAFDRDYLAIFETTDPKPADGAINTETNLTASSYEVNPEPGTFDPFR
jgi:hypothetical protein